MRVIFLIPYPVHEAPSQRFRFEQYLNLLKENNINTELRSFTLPGEWKVLYEPGRWGRKIVILLKGFIKRFVTLSTIFRYDLVFIHREAAPAGPPVIEWLVAKVFSRKVIYDFDDSIWLTDKTRESYLEKLIRFRKKVSLICKWSYKVSCGNDYLCHYAQQFNERVIKNPTTIDTEHLHCRLLHPIEKENGRIIIGWTGSHSTLKYLLLLEDVLERLQNKYSYIDFLVVADRPPDWKIRTIFKAWSKSTEISDLLLADIGIMPLPDDEWANGKCGFKALQYMALEIPAVISPVGMNSTLIQSGVNGFLASSAEEWMRNLEVLIGDGNLRKQLGKAGRQTVIERFSIASNSQNFLSLFS